MFLNESSVRLSSNDLLTFDPRSSLISQKITRDFRVRARLRNATPQQNPSKLHLGICRLAEGRGRKEKVRPITNRCTHAFDLWLIVNIIIELSVSSIGLSKRWERWIEKETVRPVNGLVISKSEDPAVGLKGNVGGTLAYAPRGLLFLVVQLSRQLPTNSK